MSFSRTLNQILGPWGDPGFASGLITRYICVGISILLAVFCMACSKHSEPEIQTSSSIMDTESKMLEKRQILIDVPINDECANITIAKLLFLQKLDANTPISLYIDSPGGSVTQTLAIVETVSSIRPPVYTYGLSHINGSAVWILAAGTLGHRHCQPNSQLSIEPTSITATDSKVETHLPNINETLANLLSSRSKLTHSEVSDALRIGRSFTPTEAIAAGIVDTTHN